MKQSSRWLCQENGSDKEYTINLEPKGDGWMVVCHYGRRGGTQAIAIKTKEPVDYDTALKAYNKEVKTRLSKGYHQDGESTSMATVEQKENTGMLPQLLNSVDYKALSSLMLNNDWCFQQKFDGQRRLFSVDKKGVISANKKGQSVPFPSSVGDTLLSLTQFAPFIVDGELIGNKYRIFDIRMFKGENVENKEYVERLTILNNFGNVLNEDVLVVYTAITTSEKKALFDAMEADGMEGVVAKRLDSKYVPYRPATGGEQLKYKFIEDATCIVTNVHPTKRSVALGLLDDAGNVVDVGNCTVPPNKKVPDAGKLVDIKYLYAYKGGSLYQPVYDRERDDITRDECKLTRLKYKAEA